MYGAVGYGIISVVALFFGYLGNYSCMKLGKILCFPIFAPIAIYKCYSEGCQFSNTVNQQNEEG